MEPSPFSSPDEFPTPRNFLACFSGLNDRQAHGERGALRRCNSPMSDIGEGFCDSPLLPSLATAGFCLQSVARSCRVAIHGNGF